MATASSTDQVNAVVARVKAYTTPTPATTSARLAANRVYAWQAPPAAVYPYIVIRKQNAVTNPDVANLRETFEIEAVCYHRPLVKEVDCERLADLVEQAILTWNESSPSAGMSYTVSCQRDRLPFSSSPADKEVVAVRLLFSCVSWPTYLTAAV